MNKWEARSQFGQSTQRRIGYFDNELEAAYAYDYYVLSVDPQAQVNGVPKIPNIESKFSKKKTIKYYAQVGNKFRASVTVGGIRRSESVDTEEKAIELTRCWLKENEQLKKSQKISHMKFRYEGNIGFFKIHLPNSEEEVEIKFDNDEKTLNLIKNYTWGFQPGGYVVSSKNHIYLHALIAGKPESPDLIIDHINRDKLDNRRENLRIVTKSVNCHNRAKKKNTKSIYIGIKKRSNGLFYGRVTKDRKEYCTTNGYADEKDAAIARDQLAIKLYGNNACLNFPTTIIDNSNGIEMG